MIGGRAGPQWSSVESLRDEAHLYRGLSRASTTGRLGDAMKMDEYVPTITPIRKENAKSFRTGPPKKYKREYRQQNCASGEDCPRERFIN